MYIAGRLACSGPLWTNLSLWYPAGDCWRSGSLEKDWEVRGGCAHGCTWAAGLANKWCYMPRRIKVVFYATKDSHPGRSWEKTSDQPIALQG